MKGTPMSHHSRTHAACRSVCLIFSLISCGILCNAESPAWRTQEARLVVAPQRITRPAPKPAATPSVPTSPPLSVTLDLERPFDVALERSLITPLDKDRKRRHWEAFEAEFGIHEKYSFALQRHLASAKYHLDVATYTIDRFLGQIDDALDLKFQDGQWRWANNRNSRRADDLSLKRPGLLDDASLDIDLELRGARPYLGVRFVLLFGS